MYNLIKQEKNARLGIVYTAHGDFSTPCFMNVATSAAIKGGISTKDLVEIDCQVMLCNTYHLHLRPGDDLINKMGGLSEFTNWDRPILTDSGGFQIFSLASNRKVTDNGVLFRSHIDGSEIFIDPEKSMQIQSNLASSIAMAFDECIDSRSDSRYIKEASDRTVLWLKRCKDEMELLKNTETTLNKQQLLFGINQGACDRQIRVDNMKSIEDLNMDGYAIGGLAVGETNKEMYDTISIVEEYMPKDKARYLMGVGTPVDILEGVRRGVDMFDCVMPTRNGRHGHFFTVDGVLNIFNEKYKYDEKPIDNSCSCEVCRNLSRSYIRHLFTAKEILALRLGAYHNLFFYNDLMKKIRKAISDEKFESFYRRYIDVLGQRI